MIGLPHRAAVADNANGQPSLAERAKHKVNN